jgi:hypothetical protein
MMEQCKLGWSSQIRVRCFDGVTSLVATRESMPGWDRIDAMSAADDRGEASAPRPNNLVDIDSSEDDIELRYIYRDTASVAQLMPVEKRRVTSHPSCSGASRFSHRGAHGPFTRLRWRACWVSMGRMMACCSGLDPLYMMRYNEIYKSSFGCESSLDRYG